MSIGSGSDAFFAFLVGTIPDVRPTRSAAQRLPESSFNQRICLRDENSHRLRATLSQVNLRSDLIRRHMDEATLEPLAARLADVLAGSYVIEGEIGRGGMGVVYSARDQQLKRRVAIKLLPPELAFRQEIKKRFIREAQTAARLSHPHIVPIHTVGEKNDLVYFVMGFVDGESLAQRLRRRGRLPVEEARRIIKETADALGLAHATGIIHRDVKPDNILLEGTRRRVMVTDFGIAKALSEAGAGTLTGTGVALGTPTYMSPEQAAGESDIDARSDLYALGIVAFEMLSGKPPFRAPTVPGLLMKQITEPPPDLMRIRSEIPDELAMTVMRCLEKDPESRWPTADALRRALESRTAGPYRPRPSASRRPTGTKSPQRQSPDRSRERPRDWGEWWDERQRRPEHGRSDHRRPKPPVRHRDRSRTPARKDEEAAVGETGLVRKFRSNFASYVSVNGGLLLLNVVTTGIENPWFMIPAVAWGIGLASQYGKLWAEGYSMRDVLSPPPAKDSLLAASQAQGGPLAQLPAPMPRAKAQEFGKYAEQIEQMRKDQAAILQTVQRLPESDKQLLPDVVQTVESLMERAMDLGRALNGMEDGLGVETVEELDSRIAALKEGSGDAESDEDDRRIELLQRQRDSLVELKDRRETVESQFESCLLAIQNVRFDLLRLRSAGVEAVISDLTSATQQARALRLDVEVAIDAAGEIREALGKEVRPS
jgi:serine/threonine-protein kinase